MLFHFNRIQTLNQSQPKKENSESKHRGCGCFLLFAASLLIRIIIAAVSDGFSSDISCFSYWANRMFEIGPGGFYSPEVFTDYPPGYMYILYPIGAILSLLRIPYMSAAHLIILRLPAIFCDLFCGILLYRQAKQSLSESWSLILSALFLFNPAVIQNSSVWGQVDSVFTFTLVLMLLSLCNKKMLQAYIAFGAALLIKPQALFLAPVILFVFLNHVIFENFSLKRLLLHLGQIMATVTGMLLLCLPFGFSNVWNQYFSTVSSYPYASVNAANLWALLGKNWVAQSELFWGLPLFVWGILLVLLIFAIAFLLFWHNRADASFPFFLSAFLTGSIFFFSVRMHERYIYPAMLFLLFAFVYKPCKQLLYCYIGLTLMHFANTTHVLYYYNPENYEVTASFLPIAALGMLLAISFLCFLAVMQYTPLGAGRFTDSAPFEKNISLKRFFRLRTAIPRPSRKKMRLKKFDWICMVVITVIYSFFALYDLGDTCAPVTTHEMTQAQSITLDFDGRVPSSLHYYIAPWNDRTFRLEEQYSTELPGSAIWRDCGTLSLDNVFTWQSTPLSVSSSRLRLTLSENQASLIELVFLDIEGSVLTPVNAGDYPALFDEQALFPTRSNFRNSMYFDEIYHGRTAYEFLHGLTAYENTHPPLGKILISLGIALFGMNPFGWRIIGVLFGIGMVPVSYLFARKLTRNTPAAVLACVLFTFDFMHFTQTRLSTIDVFITFFVMLMYFFLYWYCSLSFYDTPLHKTLLPLGLCGISMGLGIACKWTGVYAGAGLAVLFFSNLLRRYREYKYAKRTPQEVSNGIPHRQILERFCPYTIKTIALCVLFFVVIPVLIYLLSYIPFRDYADNGLFIRMLQNQETMLSYHGNLNATHPYSSSWYEWPIIKRPIWYFSSIVTGSYGNGGLREGISAFGNPLVWWPGIPAACYMIYRWIKKKDRTAAFLTIGYLAQYLPWFFVTRITFIYHYFPSVIFFVLMLAYTLTCWQHKLTKRDFILLCSIYGAAVVALFLLFYPVLSGQPVDEGFVTTWLRWFDTWVLTSK